MGDKETRGQGDKEIISFYYLFPIPNAPYPMPNAQCPMPIN
ncbi:histidine kinase [Scytonema hofmannii FACHB-248]|uniref:Histidine kinase n=1 Tax=Scytonema hofmannii FACHB-248 TaxID=1842502 RepID=A0ABR8GPI1_9CYAN|nr:MULTISPECIES: histidine kinase [Nostocales]MBD2605137.1 histidine kinase [Scytonema hofmannii FACHB-248]